MHCECGNDFVNGNKIDDLKCSQFNEQSGSHCDGPFMVSGDIGKYLLGAGDMNSAYSVNPGKQLKHDSR